MMKKILSSLFIVSAAIMGSSAVAQEVVEVVTYTQENPYLPKQGDFAVGIDLIPIVKTVCNAFSDNYKYDNEGVGGVPFLYDTENMYTRPNVSIMGKYMITNQWAAKVNIGLHLRNNTERVYVEDQLNTYLDPNSNAKVVDSKSLTESGCTFQLGAEYRLGKHRVQGIFGFGILAGFSTKNVKYSYGNELTDFNRNPISGFDSKSSIAPNYRVTSSNFEGPNGAFGVYGSVGLEWFVGKKIALGASVDLYCYGTWSSKAVEHSEGFNEAYQKVEKRTDLVSPGNKGAAFGTDNIGGSLYTIFYF